MNSLWPIHPQILPDELLSSWMIRLARDNCFKVHSFYVQFFGRHREIWTRDIDHHAPQWLIEGLSAKTGLPSARIEQATLRAYESYVFEKLTSGGTTRWLMPLSVFHRTRRSFGQQFCPACLAEDSIPYFRRSWRLALTTLCTRHAVLLQDRCGVCASPVVPHRGDMSASRSWSRVVSMRHCSFCQSTIGTASRNVSQGDLSLQMRIDRAVEQGFSILANTPLYSHLYFDGLRILIRGLAKSEKRGAGEPWVFERLTAQERLLRLHAATQLLEQWPEQLLVRCASLKRPYAIFSEGMGPIPWWLSEVMRRELLHKPALLTSEEADAIAVVSARQSGSASRAAARRLSGRDISKLLPMQPVPDDVVEALQASLTRRIGEAQGGNGLLLLRDRAMFSVGRYLHLSLPRLLLLPVSQFEALVLEGSDGGDGSNPWQGIKDIWMSYLYETRPLITKGLLGGALFTSLSGHPIGPNAVGARFRQAICYARLTPRVKCWNQWIL